MSANKLILTPAEGDAPVMPPALIAEALRACGFIGDRLRPSSDAHHYYPGEHFLELLPFSPPPPEPGMYWSAHTIELELIEAVECLGGAYIDTTKPDCGSCGEPADAWDVIDSWYASNKTYRWRCPRCERLSKVWELDWHHYCGFGRQTISVWHVGINAAPSAEFLEVLSGLGAGPWRYLYFHI